MRNCEWALKVQNMYISLSHRMQDISSVLSSCLGGDLARHVCGTFSDVIKGLEVAPWGENLSQRCGYGRTTSFVHQVASTVLWLVYTSTHHYNVRDLTPSMIDCCCYSDCTLQLLPD